ncbi:MAG: helix-turn-helix domain-containing protein [Bacteroidota bacterium]
MELNYNFTTLLDSIAFIQGATLGALLIILNKKKHKSTFFLGLFLVFFSWKLLYFIFKDLNVSALYPELFLLPFNFSWLLFGLFFIYTQQVSGFSDYKEKYWVLMPGIVSFVLQLIIFFLPYQTKLTISESPWHDFLFTYLGICYSWGIGIWNLKVLNKHQIKVNNYFSMVESRELQWARFFLIYSLVSSVIIHILYYISPSNFYFKVIFSVFDLIAIYWVSFHGVVQRNVLSILTKKELYEISEKKPNQAQNEAPMTNDSMKKLIDEIDRHMINSESFTLTELTILDLAKALNIHPRRISTAINKIRRQNFNTYVNKFRIKKAELLLSDENSDNLSVEGIGNEVGFHSKSAFYSAFKKETGTTPSKYKKTIFD